MSLMSVALGRKLGERFVRPRTAGTAIDSCAEQVARELVRAVPGLDPELAKTALRIEFRIAAQDVRLAAREGRL